MHLLNNTCPGNGKSHFTDIHIYLPTVSAIYYPEFFVSEPNENVLQGSFERSYVRPEVFLIWRASTLDNEFYRWYIFITYRVHLNSVFAQSKPWETGGRRATKLNKTASFLSNYECSSWLKKGPAVLYASRAAKGSDFPWRLFIWSGPGSRMLK
jgi:hypothetical protein